MGALGLAAGGSCQAGVYRVAINDVQVRFVGVLCLLWLADVHLHVNSDVSSPIIILYKHQFRSRNSDRTKHV